jgi:putative transposase
MSSTPSFDNRIWGLSVLDRWSHLSADLSPDAKKRLAWFDHYRRSKNVALTCRHFGISRKTFYYWRKRYAPHRLSSLETQPSIPVRRRRRSVTQEQEMRIIALRKSHLRYGSRKIAWLYRVEHGEAITGWTVQKVIEKWHLYYRPVRHARIQARRRSALKKRRITELKKREVSGFLICLDTIALYWNGVKRYIFTGIDSVSKIAFARMYTTKASYNGADFLMRLSLLLDGKILNVGHDNGTEFQKDFATACAKMGIPQYFSRPKTPKDNAVCERFNQTLRHEFLEMGNLHSDPVVFNRNLTEWLIEYNLKRPHQSLGYVPPINYEAKYLRVLPTYPSRTSLHSFPSIIYT